ncbi:ATP-binding protein [Nesterenkonia alkaliphila]|uniref:biotin carboxylase n=1 Tax=Nesterenkonia alkaliphila TaxID=1463631 RepID=A0A7K1UFH1_9MICC|nr:biotin carboxylase N-terminal domain-containing protein [Nesterenkonia alkaliphila]MVT24831.1 biotin/lipoyl-binding protein [Nesterenkonia alkaliphila]GFZ93637.1 acetyl/propionyl-CoA carboxylase subuit alpha [Nesterenkonia alkaliphila]
MFRTVLVANRGEIACRVIRTLRQLGIRSVAVYAEGDHGPHTSEADQALRIGPAGAATYLDIEAIMEAAQWSGAEAIHPGYGFLSENAAFARACTASGITFIGPEPYALEVMGDKIRAKNHVAQAGVPLVEGISEPGLSDEQLIAAAEGMTYPVLIKPSAGGGGKGMHVVDKPQDLPETLKTARRVAKAAFGDDTLLIEQLIRSPRHIEVQILADSRGNTIHLGERECSLQRRHQKVIEEAPSALLDEATRQRIGEAACATARSVGYLGAGTVEFLVPAEAPETFYFMEMNTRLQVEHPVTEEVTGIDLVAQQIRIAAGLPLEITQQDVNLTGHSVEARVYAEDPASGFMPSTGEILCYQEPEGAGIRVDSGIRRDQEIGTGYDPMLAKVIATGADREQAFVRLEQALAGTVILGVTTNISFLRQLAADPEVRAGQMDTTLIERRIPQMEFPTAQQHHAEAAAAALSPQPAQGAPLAWRRDGWRSGEPVPARYQVLPSAAGSDQEPFTVTLQGPLRPDSGTRTVTASATREGTEVWVHAQDYTGAFTVLDHQAQVLRHLSRLKAEHTEAVPEVTAPMPGTVVSVGVVDGSAVTTGQVLVTLEAMKMEHQLTAPLEGTARIHVNQGQTVKLGQVVAAVEAAEEPAAAADSEHTSRENTESKDT